MLGGASQRYVSATKNELGASSVGHSLFSCAESVAAAAWNEKDVRCAVLLFMIYFSEIDVLMHPRALDEGHLSTYFKDLIINFDKRLSEHAASR